MSQQFQVKAAVSFGMLELRLTDAAVALLPRSARWRLTSLGNHLRMTPSNDGTAAEFRKDADGFHTTYRGKAETVVHHRLMERPAQLIGSTLEVDLGHPYRWPWCRGASRTTPKERASRFRAEWNARIHSFLKHDEAHSVGAVYQPPDWWQEVQLTPAQRAELMLGRPF